MNIKKNLGRFKISRELIHGGNHKPIMQVFSNMIPLRTEYLYPSDQLEYIAYSPLFEEVSEGSGPIDYKITCTETRDDNENITGYEIKAEKIK